MILLLIPRDSDPEIPSCGGSKLIIQNLPEQLVGIQNTLGMKDLNLQSSGLKKTECYGDNDKSLCLITILPVNWRLLKKICV